MTFISISIKIEIVIKAFMISNVVTKEELFSFSISVLLVVLLEFDFKAEIVFITDSVSLLIDALEASSA